MWEVIYGKCKNRMPWEHREGSANSDLWGSGKKDFLEEVTFDLGLEGGVGGDQGGRRDQGERPFRQKIQHSTHKAMGQLY